LVQVQPFCSFTAFYSHAYQRYGLNYLQQLYKQHSIQVSPTELLTVPWPTVLQANQHADHTHLIPVLNQMVIIWKMVVVIVQKMVVVGIWKLVAAELEFSMKKVDLWHW